MSSPVCPHRAWPLFTALRAWLIAALLALAGAAAPAQVVTLNAALSAVGEGRSFPIDESAKVVKLPDEWHHTRRDQPGPVWYRLHFQAEGARASGELMALYIAHVCTNLEVFFNGQVIYSGGRMTEPLSYNCNHPQLVNLPAALMQPGENALDIKVVGHPLAHTGSSHRAGGLSELQIGPQAQLAVRHGWQKALNVDVSQALSSTLLLMGGFMFVLGWMNRRESHLAYFGALAMGWAVVESRKWLRDLPFENSVAEFLLCAMLPLLTLAGVQFLLRYAELRLRWVTWALAVQCVVVPLSLLLAGPGRLYPVASFWYVLLAAQALWAACMYLGARWHVRQRHAFWPMASFLACAFVALAVEYFAQKFAHRSLATQLAQMAMPVMMVLVGLRLLQQHGRALQSAEETKAILEARIREATDEIERNFTQMSELRVEQVTERERKRIAADLHDDLGAKLLTIVHTSESERISTLAREALEEMRLSVRGLTGKPVRLIDALGDWRAEVVSRLAQAAIEADWSAPSEDDFPQTLSARAFVQTTRILREAVSNIIKHSGATHCSLRCTLADGDFQVVVQDNGEGIPMELDGRLDRGHGMASMKHRAKQLAGQCLVESGPGFGTVIRLTIPLERATIVV